MDDELHIDEFFDPPLGSHNFEIGHAWAKKSKNGTPYFEVSIHALGIGSIECFLRPTKENPNKYILWWNRDKKHGLQKGGRPKTSDAAHPAENGQENLLSH